MAKVKHRNVKFPPEEMAYDLPDELDLKKLRRVGTGISAFKKLAERSKRTVSLDPDVAKVFRDSAAVNGMLRAIMSSLPK